MFEVTKSYRCTKKSCKARITTDADNKIIIQHYEHNNSVYTQKTVMLRVF